MLRRNSLLVVMLACLAGPLFAQGPGAPDGGGFGGPSGRPPMERTFHDREFGRWWNNPRIAQQLGITDQQKKEMDDIFLQHRLKLIDLDASLEKQQTLLRPMIEADQPNEGKILAQIDAVAQARADLEKENARMLFALRRTLSTDQWNKLKALRAERHVWRQRRQDGGPPQGPQPNGPPSGQQAPPPPPQQP